MEQLEPVRITQQRLEIRRRIVAAPPEADEMFLAAPIRELDEAQAIARRIQAHRLRIDGDWPLESHVGGQVFFVEIYAHSIVLALSVMPP